ncbi:MAG: type II toxin-antitoxin system VapC family toxin [Pseudonocardiaceae bacterium]
MVGLVAADMDRSLQKAGSAIGLSGCLQTGVCVWHGLPLATRIGKHFDRVAGLQLIDVDVS